MIQCVSVCVCEWVSYIVQYSGPSLHGDTLEDSENSKQDVVKLSNAIIRANPSITAVVAGRTLTHATRELQLRGVHCLVSWTERCTDRDRKQKYITYKAKLPTRQQHFSV